MAEGIVERLPLPNLRVYTAGSVLALSVAVYGAARATSDPAAAAADPPRNTTQIVADAVLYLIEDPLSIWAIINMAYCGLALVGWGVQCAVFGRLRGAEAARLKDRLWNYVFYKLIFVFGVINAQHVDEVLLWAAWFTLLGALYLLTQLCNDRLDYAGAMASGGGEHAALAVTLAGAGGGAAVLAAAGGTLLLRAAPPLAAFCLAECLVVCLLALRSLCRLWLSRRELDAAAAAAYYPLLAFDVAVTATETLDTLHMVARCRLAPSLASLLLLLRLRAQCARLAALLAAHRARAAALAHMTARYPLASREEMARNQDKCAICWQPMYEARKLPCMHLFHSGCLCGWVAQHASCPTCRRDLPRPPPRAAPAPAPTPAPAPPAPPAPPHHDLLQHASRVVWWLPSLSVDLPAPHAHVEALLAEEVQPPAPRAAPRLGPPASRPAPPARVDAHTSTSVEAATSTTFIRNVERRPTWSTKMTTANPLFPKEASERERVLQLRKQALVEEARRKYLDKMSAERAS